MDSNEKEPLSDELQEWLANRDEILKFQKSIADRGGCVLPSKSAVNPDYLRGSLRREARRYFKNLDKLIGLDK